LSPGSPPTSDHLSRSGASGASYQEEERLALYITGNFETENWQNKSRPVNYYDLAQFVFILLQKSLPSQKGGLENYKQEKINDPLFDYGMKIVTGKVEIGRLGKVKAALVKDLGIKQEIFYADLDMALLVGEHDVVHA
jgi:phenylalanyl-tRNA synthetase beta chain